MVVAGLGLLGSLCFPQHPHTSVWGVYAFFCLGSKPRSRIAGSPGSSCAPLLGVCPGGVSQGVHRSVFPQGSPCAPFPHPPTPALHFPSPPLCAPPLPLQSRHIPMVPPLAVGEHRVSLPLDWRLLPSSDYGPPLCGLGFEISFNGSSCIYYMTK